MCKIRSQSTAHWSQFRSVNFNGPLNHLLLKRALKLGIPGKYQTQQEEQGISEAAGFLGTLLRFPHWPSTKKHKNSPTSWQVEGRLDFTPQQRGREQSEWNVGWRGKPSQADRAESRVLKPDFTSICSMFCLLLLPLFPSYHWLQRAIWSRISVPWFHPEDSGKVDARLGVYAEIWGCEYCPQWCSIFWEQNAETFPFLLQIRAASKAA